MKKYLDIIVDAMVQLISEKGAMNKMVSVEDIEAYLMKQELQAFVPVSLSIKSLIDFKYVRYMKLDSGRLMYGFTKFALDDLAKMDKQEVAPTQEEPQTYNPWSDSDIGEELPFNEEDLPFDYKEEN